MRTLPKFFSRQGAASRQIRQAMGATLHVGKIFRPSVLQLILAYQLTAARLSASEMFLLPDKANQEREDRRYDRCTCLLSSPGLFPSSNNRGLQSGLAGIRSLAVARA